jgi:EmrB/QacA subfamily drug resistance transporter
MNNSRPERPWLALTLLVSAQFMVIIDLTIVTIALPSIQLALHFAANTLQWVLGAYMLAFGGGLLLGGRISDLFGRRRVFMTGLALFGLSTLGCGLAQNSAELVTARAVQGLGGALFSPAALALLALTFPREAERVRAMSLWSAAAAAGGATGLVAGGLLTTGAGWRWVFWVNIPFVVAGLAFAPSLLSAGRMDDDSQRHLDVAGAVLGTAGLSALIYGLTELAATGTGWPQFAIPLAASVVLLAGFVVVERRAAQPLLPFAYFRQRQPTLANCVMLAFGAAIVAMNYLISLYLQRVLHYTPLQAGLSFLPMAVGTVVFSQLAARFLQRAGLRATLLTGLVAGAAALFWFGTIPPNGSYLVNILGPAILLGAAGGFGIVAVMTAAVSGVSERDAGLSGGLINTAQQLGGALGLAAFASLAAWRSSDLAAGSVPDASALTAGFRLGLDAAAILTLLTAALAAAMLARGRRGTPVAADAVPAGGSGRELAAVRQQTSE